ncbi:MAG: hypothetical protein KDA77_07955 [Planctomycetaceae bacterium]|nr:hypothetical protein [Planctomycetaceae bacterium]
MHTITREQVAAKLRELNLYLSPAISYRLETLFPRVEGWFVKGRIKDQVKLIQRLEPLLTEILLVHEEVQLVVKCNQSTLADVFLTGSIWIETTTYNLLVFSNLRVLCIRVDDKGVPLKTYWQIYYNQINKMQHTLFGNARLFLRDGTKLIYTGIPIEDRDRMQETVQENRDLFRNKGFAPAVTQSREQLCGHCYDVIPPGVYECECCGATYWRPAEVGVRSLIFPSWGDFVMQHHMLAIMELFGFVLLLWFTSAAFSEGKYGTGLTVFFMANLADALMSVQIATRALHLKSVPLWEDFQCQKPFDWEQVQFVKSDARSDYTGYQAAAFADEL